ncbi:asparaginyl-tRNA synthetase [Hypoxylon fragiforme]|uniref:asparaginyl-tRNA synthetase n=1 Tax=Hypoxylon fragiforme TaxID=63214 RepID=UPI0020C72020|nr:asparaginyl-tRNA synthetase [Hypoxylon fragiforme]KAI2603601.1 asparaginyl-tRNA synthetase [Hypoxylon fragiforme]
MAWAHSLNRVIGETQRFEHSLGLHGKNSDGGCVRDDVYIDGFVRSVRAQKEIHFVTLSDGSSLEPLQAVVPVSQAKGVTIGSAVRLHGSWTPSRGSGQSHELQVQSATVLGPSDPKTFPLQKKFHTPDYLRGLPHLRPRAPFNSLLLRFRSELIASLTRFFTDRQFNQTHTPILTSSDCEGAGEVFHVSAGDPSPSSSSSPSTPNTPKTSNHFFRRPVYTTVSAQLHLEALAQALGNVWTLSPTFRAEQSNTPRHLSEFYMLEAEMSFTDEMDSVMDLVEDMLRHICTDLAGSRVQTEVFAERKGDRATYLHTAEQVSQRWQGLMQKKWPRITYTEAMKLLESSKKEFSFSPVWGNDLTTEHERYIATEVGGGNSPVFVTNYPRDIKAFYMRGSAEDRNAPPPGMTVDCFDLLVPDFLEIAGGSMREHRLEQLQESMRARGMTPTISPVNDTKPATEPTENNLDWYVDLRRWGCPPHGGFGLGFDRLVCYLTGVMSIQDTPAFPRWYGRCDC